MLGKKNTLYGAILVAAIASLPAVAPASSDVAKGNNGLRASASIDVRVDIPHVMQMKLAGHPTAIDVTADDIARGSIRITGASVDLLVNDRFGYYIRADLAGGEFSAVRIAGLSSPVVATQAGALIQMASMVGKPKPAPMPVEYELQLAPDAQPGHYAWPVTLSLQQL